LNYQLPFPFKRTVLLTMFFCLLLLTGYVDFVAVICINIGLYEQHQQGFFVPIVVGAVVIIVSLWIFVCLSKTIFNHMKERTLQEM
jgi:hypothetical protein